VFMQLNKIVQFFGIYINAYLILIKYHLSDCGCTFSFLLLNLFSFYDLQELVNSKSSNMVTNDSVHSQGKQQCSDQSANTERGWLNWLSLGMLGAGGTADSSSFAGVVSDEIIKV